MLRTYMYVFLAEACFRMFHGMENNGEQDMFNLSILQSINYRSISVCI